MRFVGLLLLAGCAALPRHDRRPLEQAIQPPEGTPLGELTAQHPGESGFALLNTGRSAIQARVALAEAAQSSILPLRPYL